MSSATMTSKGRITLPKDIRERLGVAAGDRLEFVVGADGEVRVQPAKIDISALYGLLQRPQRSVTLEQLESSVAAAARRKR